MQGSQSQRCLVSLYYWAPVGHGAHLSWDPKKTFCSIFEKLSCSVDKYEVVTALRRDQTSHNDRSKPLLGIQLSNYPIILFTYIMITALKINF